jgi:hypothetical protein
MQTAQRIPHRGFEQSEALYARALVLKFAGHYHG